MTNFLKQKRKTCNENNQLLPFTISIENAYEWRCLFCFNSLALRNICYLLCCVEFYTTIPFPFDFAAKGVHPFVLFSANEKEKTGPA